MEKKHTFSVLSFARTVPGNSNVVSIYLRLTIDGRRTEISTKTIVPRTKWVSSKGRVAGTTEEARMLNHGIISFEHRAREIYNRFIEQGKIISRENIKNELLGIVHKQRLLLEQFSITVEEMEKQKGLGFAPGTIKNWKVTQRHFQEFLLKHHKCRDISFKELKLKFITDFEWFAKVQWGCGNNAILKHIQRLRKVVKKAIINDWLMKDPFLGFESSQEKSHRSFLTIDEVNAIKNKNFSIPRLQHVADIFIFCCYTGLAHVDVDKLTVSNLAIGIDGKKWIYTFRQKTGAKSNVPLLPHALEIIEKYQNTADCINDGKLLPVISNIKTNAYLKEISDICGITKNLTFHMARHTFATTITLTNGVPIETVSRMLGHSKITTTQIYAKVLENKVSEDMKNLEERLTRRQ